MSAHDRAPPTDDDTAVAAGGVGVVQPAAATDKALNSNTSLRVPNIATPSPNDIHTLTQHPPPEYTTTPVDLERSANGHPDHRRRQQRQRSAAVPSLPTLPSIEGPSRPTSAVW
jgi:hypothetical protein